MRRPSAPSGPDGIIALNTEWQDRHIPESEEESHAFLFQVSQIACPGAFSFREYPNDTTISYFTNHSSNAYCILQITLSGYTAEIFKEQREQPVP